MVKDDICPHCRFYKKTVFNGRIVSEKCTNSVFTNNNVHFKKCTGFSRSLKSRLKGVWDYVAN